MSEFKSKLQSLDDQCKQRKNLEIVQVNMGNLCNMACRHCHVAASPNGKNIMSKEAVDAVLNFLAKHQGLVLDITGGAPELNPNFRYLVRHARQLVKEIIVRSNLTVLWEEGQEDTCEFFKENKLRVVCSLPCYTEANVDAQRGKGTFDKSIKALKKLNSIGYGTSDDLMIDLVYNPGGAFLPGPQKELERDYKELMKKDYGIDFNSLITITNVPIKRFKDDLEGENIYGEYMKLLKDNFNKDVVTNLMCRSLLSVAWDCTVYDCDFNQALCMPLLDKAGKALTVSDVEPDRLVGRRISFADHCFACTAGSGSSCQGALDDKV